MKSANALVIYDKKILLLLRDDKKDIPDPNTWSLPGGEVEDGEDFEQALRREILEECCISPKDVKYLGKISDFQNIEHAIYITNLSEAEANNVKLGNEGQDLKFFDFDEMTNLPLSQTIKFYYGIYGSYIQETIKNGRQLDPSKLGLKP